MKETFGVLLLVGLYILPAGIIVKYGTSRQSSLAFIPVVNVIGASVLLGNQAWKYIHER